MRRSLSTSCLALAAWLLTLCSLRAEQVLLTIEPTAEQPRNSEGDVIELEDGRLCLIYTRFTGGGADHSAADLALRVSEDGGRSWSDDRIVVPCEGGQNVMSVSLLRLADGRIALFYIRKQSIEDCRPILRISTDECATFGPPIVCITDEVGYYVLNNDRAVQLSGGRLILPVAMHNKPGQEQPDWAGRVMCYLSDDTGKTWRRSQSVLIGRSPEGNRVTVQEPGVVELQDGRLMMFCRTNAGSQYVSYSEDRGDTWSPLVPSDLKSPLSPATIERIPWSGELLCVWNDHGGVHEFSAGKRTPLCLAISRDDGKTWSRSRVIEPDPDGWYCYTAMAFVKDRVLLAYCAGDSRVGRLNRLKLVAFSREQLSELFAASSPRPNVILILTDDQGYGDLSCHGNPVLRTPRLDELYAESIRLTDFHVTPMCTPTRGELLAGRDALANGAYCVCSGRTFLRQSLPTMADLFAAAGYRTGLFGKWHLGDNFPHRPNDRGFHEALYHLGWGITSTPDYWNNDYFDDRFRRNGRVEETKGYCTDVFFSAAEQWIRTCVAEEKPFFAYLSLNAPHGPFYAPAKYKEPYREHPPDVAGFFGMIANLDENVGRLDAMLRESGLRENTILIFMTDNGGTGGISVFNAGMRGAKASLYEGGHRVPCFIRWPGGNLRPPGDVADLTSAKDVLPTLLDLCSLERRAGIQFDGVSLVPLLRGETMPQLASRTLVVQYGGLVESQPSPWDAAVMWNGWRLVHGRELYDIHTDPGQQEDVASQNPEIVSRLRGDYEAWWAEVAPSLDEYEVIGVGSDRENPTTLSSMDWLAPRLTPAAQPFDIRLAGKTVVAEGSLPMGRPQPVMNGVWNLRVDRAGTYRIALRRWPKEADAPITALVPEYVGVDGTFAAGIALPIARARLQIGGIDQTKPVADQDKAAVFEVDLAAGPTRLQTWFYDSDGKEICGAFYVEVFRE